MDWKIADHRAWKATVAEGSIAVRRVGLLGQQWLRGWTDLIFPPICLLCGEETSETSVRLCTSCKGALVDDSARCSRCAKPLPRYFRDDPTGCPLCKNKRIHFQNAIALGTYGDQIRDLILLIKQPRHESLCLAAGKLLASRVSERLGDSRPDLVTSVPMHWFRKLWRGTNDSELLCEAVGHYMRIEHPLGVLHCRRPTRKQGTLMPVERRRNVRGAYRVRRKVEGAHVLVVDDVMTTGATANELAKVLIRAGAKRVTVAVVARGVGFD